MTSHERKNKMKRLMITVAAIVAMGAVSTQDATAADSTTSPQVEVVNDGGVEAVREAMDAAPVEPPKKVSNAEAEVKAWVKGKKWRRGWDAKKKRFVKITVESFDCDDPAKVQNVMVQRDMAVKRAVLMAKDEIIQAVKVELDAEDIVSSMASPGMSDDEQKELGEHVQKMKQSSDAEFRAAMPLFGATCVRQTESWNKGKYQVAVALVWSPALERSARAIITGNKVICKPKENGKDIEAWLESINPAFMSGPIQFVDADGTRWFIGVSAGAADEDLDSLTLRNNRRIADLSAKQMLAFSLWGDVKAHEAKRQELVTKTLNGKSSTEVAQWLDSTISQSIKGLPLRGMTQLYSEEVDHPVTGGRIYVSIYGINQNGAEDMLKVEAVNYATRAELERAKTVERGRAAANRAHVENATNDPRDFVKGFNAQSGAIHDEAASRKGVQQIQQKELPQKRNKAAQAGVFNGGADVDDNDL